MLYTGWVGSWYQIHNQRLNLNIFYIIIIVIIIYQQVGVGADDRGRSQARGDVLGDGKSTQTVACVVKIPRPAHKTWF